MAVTRSPAQEIVRVMSFYRGKSSGLAQAALLGVSTFREWQHYPRGDARDEVHGVEFYYHAHAADERIRDEHGHFHVFSRPEPEGDFIHLVGISLNAHGLPIRLFLTNQWVTGETWASAAKAQRQVDRFCFRGRGPLAPLGTWVTAMIRLYRAEIHLLHESRERWVQGKIAAFPARRDLLQSRQYQVIAQQRVNLLQRLSSEIV
jgi:hypothetical protein